MVAEQYLDQIKKIDAMIKNRLSEYDRWVEVADGLGGASVGERVQTSRNLHRGADAIGNYIDIEKEINALKAERQSIIKNIEKLPSTEYDLIYKLFVGEYDKQHDCMRYYTLKELAYHFGKSYDWVKFKKKRALQLVQAMLNEREQQTST